MNGGAPGSIGGPPAYNNDPDSSKDNGGKNSFEMSRNVREYLDPEYDDCFFF